MELKAFYRTITVAQIGKVELHTGLIRQPVIRIIARDKTDYYMPIGKQQDIVVGDTLDLKYKCIRRYNAGVIRMVSAFKKLALTTPNVTT
jgi:hypothetical protein